MTNYHTHTLFCDGRCQMRDHIRFALDRGFNSLGFSSHAPLPFPTAWTMEWDRMDDYLAEFHRMRRLYRSRIELYIGLEIDYLNENHHPASPCFARLPLDYRIGSVHLLYDPMGRLVDSDLPAPKFKRMIETHFEGDVAEAVRCYYARSMAMLRHGGFDIVGHADKIHYNATYMRPSIMDEPWYDVLVRTYFEAIARQGFQMEVNTKAYEELGVFYPDVRYFSFLHDLGIRVQVNTDAHYPDRIDAGRQAALQALRCAGYRSVMELHGGEWEERKLW